MKTTTKRHVIDIIMAGVRSCTGNCVYCSAANNSDVIFRNQFLNEVDYKTSKEFKIDFRKLENALVNHPNFRKDNLNIVIWGADPLSAFTPFKITVIFLEMLRKKYNLKFTMMTSTNGMPLGNKDIIDFCVKHNIIVQLSHDGVAECLRLPIDPLVEYRDNISKLKEVRVNCVAHYYNCDFKKNIEYFDKYRTPNMRIRFSKPMLGANYSKTINRLGFRNGEYFEELRGKPFGDFGIRNTEEEPHLVEDYVLNLFTLPKGYSKSGMNEPQFSSKISGCGAFSTGQRDWSNHIDTLGNCTICNLIDSLGKVENPECFDQFDECKTCRFKHSSLCRGCCINPPEGTIHSKCELLYEINTAYVILRYR